MRIVCKTKAFEQLTVYRRELLSDAQRCVMCALTARHPAENRIFEDEHSTVLLDRLGNRRGHLLAVPKRHVERFSELGIEQYAKLQAAVFCAAQALETALRPRRVFLASTGASDELPMSYPHFHVHVIPVYEADEGARPANVLSWSHGVVLYDDVEANELCALIRDAWPVTLGSPRLLVAGR